MCPEYVLYGAWLARLFGKKLGMWYLHKSVTWKLKIATHYVNYIFTAHRDGVGFRSKKIVTTGHGINVSMFNNINKKADERFNMLTVGRISRSKNLLILVKSAIILARKMNKPVHFQVVGDPYLPEDEDYLKQLRVYLKEHDAEEIVSFVGKVPHKKIATYYEQTNVFLNASETGGVDKAVREALIGGVPAITSNQAFKNMLPETCQFRPTDVDDLVQKIISYKDIPIDDLQQKIRKTNNLENTVQKIINTLFK